jgi:NADH dehydrogenase/NADH:ubiquinone oxidoreductase subunit G
VYLGLDPGLDCPVYQAAHVIAITPFDSPMVRQIAHVLLPSTPCFETAGTFVNVEGIHQTFEAVVPPYAQSQPAAIILQQLMARHAKKGMRSARAMAYLDLSQQLPRSAYEIDNLVRRSAPLQARVASL